MTSTAPFAAPATSAVSFVSCDTAMMVPLLPLLLRRPARHHASKTQLARWEGHRQSNRQTGRQKKAAKQAAA